MMNYIKSEFYRVTRTGSIYLLTGILVLLTLTLNFCLYFFSARYTTSSFSYSFLVSNPMVFGSMGAVIGFLLYEGNKRDGNLKNTVSFGISRTAVFLGECIVSVATSVLVMVIVLGVWIGSVLVLLPQTGPVTLNDVLSEVPAVFLIAAACIISALVCVNFFEKASVGIMVWLVIWFLTDKVILYLGMRFAFFYRIAMWLPGNFFGINQQHVNLSQCITVWDTPDGMLKCLISGIAGTLIFTLSGIALLRKREL